ncbi:hypothetical protein FRC07_008312 [Ceratobasidium sp. 392]|nr:hypothetical protein FRC07_008312 [Ceratobasidium sp. 392]
MSCAVKKTVIQSPNSAPVLVSVTDEAWWNPYVTTEFPINRAGDLSGRGGYWGNRSGGAWVPDLNGERIFTTDTGSRQKVADPVQGSSTALEVGLHDACHTSNSKPAPPTLTLFKNPANFQEQYKIGGGKFEEDIIGEILITGNDHTRAIHRTLTILSVVALDGSSMSQEAVTEGFQSNQATITVTPTRILNLSSRALRIRVAEIGS